MSLTIVSTVVISDGKATDSQSIGGAIKEESNKSDDLPMQELLHVEQDTHIREETTERTCSSPLIKQEAEDENTELQERSLKSEEKPVIDGSAEDLSWQPSQWHANSLVVADPFIVPKVKIDLSLYIIVC